ncbi:HAD family hydrolase [Actinacidiphila acididurans]|uniref:HAD-IA family hydrolase n=1 Tax=Actinacidiphila acididurans TaxID=2784346 RepID=A0ABS2U3Q1_9ACTN|nr:HAD-IA family hydrolase [Actinacidiphila acididurans]
MRAVGLDVGETLIRDDRDWETWADWLKVPRHTLSALVGAVVVAGRDNSDALRLARPGVDVAAEQAAREAAGVGVRLAEEDLYEDVRPVLTALRAAGTRVVVAGNQPARIGELLRALDVPADVIATSGEWGVAKPDPAFYRRVVEAAGCRPEEVVYVGDHPVNDVFPVRAAGLRSAHLRRGPWGHWWADDPEVRAAADWSIDGLADLLDIAAGRR